jgi:hypothetical protein
MERIVIIRFLNEMASFDVAQADIARHVIDTHFKPSFHECRPTASFYMTTRPNYNKDIPNLLSVMASHDVASKATGVVTQACITHSGQVETYERA